MYYESKLIQLNFFVHPTDPTDPTRNTDQRFIIQLVFFRGTMKIGIIWNHHRTNEPDI